MAQQKFKPPELKSKPNPPPPPDEDEVMPWEMDFSGEGEDDEESVSVFPIEEEMFMDFDYILGSCMTEHHIYMSCYNAAVSRNKKKWSSWFSKSGPASFIGNDCQREAQEWDLCNYDRDLRKLRVSRDCNEHIRGYELCAYEKKSTLGKDWNVLLCKPHFDGLLVCAQEVIKQCHQ